MRQNKVAPSIFCGFLSKRLEFKCEILHTYLVIICAFNSRISIQYFKVITQHYNYSVGTYSDFSALKNFVRKPVHENRSKFFQWFKITSKQLVFNDVICDVVFLNNNTANSLLMNFDCPVDTSSSKPAHTARATQNWLQTNCADFIAKDQWPPNSPTWTSLITMSGGSVGDLSQAPTETENDRRPEGSPLGDLGQPTSGNNRQSCQRVLKATEGLCCSGGGHFEHSQ